MVKPHKWFAHTFSLMTTLRDILEANEHSFLEEDNY